MESWRSEVEADIEEIKKRAFIKRDLLSLMLLSKDEAGKGILFIFYDGEILYVSNGFAKYLGYTPKELVGTNYSKYVIDQGNAEAVWDKHKKWGTCVTLLINGKQRMGK